MSPVSDLVMHQCEKEISEIKEVTPMQNNTRAKENVL